MVKQETWDALDEALRAKIEAAAELTTLQSLVHFYDQDMKAMETLRASKAEVIELDAAFQKELSDAGRDWIKKTAEAQKAEGKPRMAEILEGYLAYEDRWAEQSGYLIRNEK
ncbi:hypothetical protein [Nitratireductor aquibiodomus]|uniref:hypothetical protein n=1 Tax=Nitratireductor aquibiodomus TaxID=204799 RepID=UPI00192E4F44|nr:hypothetical protein [Nitratireductor aquibiodomus]